VHRITNAVAYTYCNCYADSDGNRHRYTHSNSYTDTNTYFHAHTEVSAHPEGSSHSATPALIPEREVIVVATAEPARRGG